jgi:hypothetical protein
MAEGGMPSRELSKGNKALKIRPKWELVFDELSTPIINLGLDESTARSPFTTKTRRLKGSL